MMVILLDGYVCLSACSHSPELWYLLQALPYSFGIDVTAFFYYRTHNDVLCVFYLILHYSIVFICPKDNQPFPFICLQDQTKSKAK